MQQAISARMTKYDRAQKHGVGAARPNEKQLPSMHL
jgi:hypothetical protein